MTSYTKSQLAQAAGVHPNTFRRWLNNDPHYQQLLIEYHIPPSAKLLPPPIVRYLNQHYDLDLPK